MLKFASPAVLSSSLVQAAVHSAGGHVLESVPCTLVQPEPLKSICWCWIVLVPLGEGVLILRPALFDLSIPLVGFQFQFARHMVDMVDTRN